MTTTGQGSERGSLPIAMLAILVVGSLVTVLVGTVVVGERYTRHDQAFEQSLQVAETGLDRMVHLVASGQRTQTFDVAETDTPGGRYSGRATRSGRTWSLEATGIINPNCPEPVLKPIDEGCRRVSRTVSVTVAVESLFGVAAYGRTQVALRGSNTADSYASGTFDDLGVFTLAQNGSNICRGDGSTADPFATAHSGDTRMCTPTGNGVVATNEELFLLGGVIDRVDRAEVHYARENVADPLPGATGFCAGVTATCTSPKLAYFREPIELQPDPVVPPADLTNQGSFAGTTLLAGRQLYTNVTLDTTTVIQGTPENPTVLYLTGTLTIPNQAVVNFQKADGSPCTAPATGCVPKPTAGLLIFSAGVGPALRFGNHASFSGGVYAPRATFSGGAAGNVYGSMVTGSISTQGSWNFHYDDALGDVDTEARRVIRNWAECQDPPVFCPRGT